MKFLIVGSGSIGRRHFANLFALGFRDIAVVRSKRELDAPQREFFAKYKPKVFYNLNTALTEKPDAIFICNPTSLHIKTALEGIRNGTHVFIEKPISHTSVGVARMLREAQKRRRVVRVGYHFRYHPLLKTVKQMVDAGKLGQLHSAQFITGEYLPGWHPWENYKKGYAARSELGGGVVLTQSHDLDLIYWFFGKPRKVMATVEKSGALGIDTDDIAAITFNASSCPVITSHLDYLARPPVKGFSINGSRGRLEWDYYGDALRITDLGGKTRVVKSPKGFIRNEMYIAELKDFLRSIRRGVNSARDGNSGNVALAMALAAKEAHRKGRVVNI